MSGQPAAVRELTQPQALSLLRKYSRVQWVLTIFAALACGGLMVLLQRWLQDRSWEDALLYGATFAVFFYLLQLAMEWFRVRRLPDTTGWTGLERAEVVSREGTEVTIRRGRTTLVAPVRQAWTVKPGDVVWVGPHLAEGQELVLVRGSAAFSPSPLLAPLGAARRA